MIDQPVVALCRDLIRIPSLSGQEGELAAFVAVVMARMGFEDIQVDAFGSVIGRRTGREAGPTLLFDVHMDTVVPASPETWRYGPWAGEIADGRLWGLGAADVKGALAALLCGLGSLPRNSFAGEILLATSVCEENLTGAAAAEILANHRIDMAVVAEPTGLRLGLAQKGRADLLLRTYGKSAHTSHPELGENAVYKMVDAVARLRRLPLQQDPDLGREVLELVEIVSEPLPGTAHVPHGCRARYLARTLPGAGAEELLARLATVLADMPGVEIALEESRLTCYTGATLVHPGFLPGWRSGRGPGEGWPERLLSALAAAGIASAPFAAGFGCNASAYAAAGIPVVICGPGSLAQAHTVDESIALADLLAGERAYAAVVQGCLGRSIIAP